MHDSLSPEYGHVSATPQRFGSDSCEDAVDKSCNTGFARKIDIQERADASISGDEERPNDYYFISTEGLRGCHDDP